MHLLVLSPEMHQKCTFLMEKCIFGYQEIDFWKCFCRIEDKPHFTPLPPYLEPWKPLLLPEKLLHM